MEAINYVFESVTNYNPKNKFYHRVFRLNVDGQPDDLTETKYDDLFGFPKGRKERKVVATREEIDSANIPNKHRDYCAHHLLKLLACKRDYSPAFWHCHHYKEALLDCKLEEYV